MPLPIGIFQLTYVCRKIEFLNDCPSGASSLHWEMAICPFPMATNTHAVAATTLGKHLNVAVARHCDHIDVSTRPCHVVRTLHRYTPQ